MTYNIRSKCGCPLVQSPSSTMVWTLCNCPKETIPIVVNKVVIERDKRNFEAGYIHGIIDVLNAAERKGFIYSGHKALFLSDLTEVKNELFLNLNK